MSRKGENIYKRKDGRWEARYIKEHRINGRIHYGYCYGKTYHEVRDKVNQARYALMNDQLLPVRGKRNRFADYCNEWLYLKRSSVKPSTFVKYTTILEKYIKPDLGQYFSEAVSEILVEQFSYRLIHERGLSPKTVRDILSVLHSILNYTAKRDGRLPSPFLPYIDKKSQRLSFPVRNGLFAQGTSAKFLCSLIPPQDQFAKQTFIKKTPRRSSWCFFLVRLKGLEPTR